MSDNDFDDDDDFCVAMDNEGRIEGTCDHLETGSRVVQLSTGVKCCLTPSRCVNTAQLLSKLQLCSELEQ